MISVHDVPLVLPLAVVSDLLSDEEADLLTKKNTDVLGHHVVCRLATASRVAARRTARFGPLAPLEFLLNFGLGCQLRSRSWRTHLQSRCLIHGELFGHCYCLVGRVIVATTRRATMMYGVSSLRRAETQATSTLPRGKHRTVSMWRDLIAAGPGSPVVATGDRLCGLRILGYGMGLRVPGGVRWRGACGEPGMAHLNWASPAVSAARPHADAQTTRCAVQFQSLAVHGGKMARFIVWPVHPHPFTRPAPPCRHPASTQCNVPTRPYHHRSSSHLPHPRHVLPKHAPIASRP